MKKIIIIGTGLAGYLLAKAFREINQTDQLTLITKDDGCFYSKPLLSTVLTNKKMPTQLPTHTADQMRDQLNASIITHAQVTTINASEKTLTYNSEDKAHTLSYDQLILATGANPIHLPVTGNAVADLLSVNNLQDYAHFYEKLQGKKRIIILGAGFVGCEFANDLCNAGIEVCVVSPDPYPLPKLVPETVGVALQNALEAKDVQWHLSRFANSVDRVDDQYHVHLSDGSTVIGDLVLCAVGIKPDVALAKTVPVAVDQGVMVNDQLQTSDADIYALGDCAQVCGTLKMYVPPIREGAKVLAKVLDGQKASIAYPVMPISIKTSNYPIVVVPPADTAQGAWEIEQTPTGIKASFIDSAKQLQGFALGGDRVRERMAMVNQMRADS